MTAALIGFALVLVLVLLRMPIVFAMGLVGTLGFAYERGGAIWDERGLRAAMSMVGRQITDHVRTSLVIDALEMARLHGHLKPGAIVHHDRGTQYASSAYAAYCADIDVRVSMGRTGVCWDNAVAESFFATLKNEMYHRQRFPTKARARFAVAEYIEVFYNRKRRHSTLAHRSAAAAARSKQGINPRDCPKSLTQPRLDWNPVVLQSGSDRSSIR